MHEIPRTLYRRVLVRWHNLGGIKIPKNFGIGSRHFIRWCPHVGTINMIIRCYRFRRILTNTSQFKIHKSQIYLWGNISHWNNFIVSSQGGISPTQVSETYVKIEKLKNLERKWIHLPMRFIFGTTDFNETLLWNFLRNLD